MKIAIFTPSFLPKCSGAEIFHHNLATQLVARGHEVVLIVPRKNVAALTSSEWDLPYALEPFHGNLWSLYKRFRWAGQIAVNQLLNRLQKKHRFDLWHVVMTWPTGVTALHWSGGRGKIPVLLRCAGDDLLVDAKHGIGLRLDPEKDRLIREEIPKASAVVSLSESITDEYLDLGVKRERIEWIPNAVDLPAFQVSINRNDVRKSLGIPATAFVFLSVGRNHPQKDYPTLFRAAGRLLREGGKFHLLVVGRESPKLRKLAAENGLGDCVTLLEMSSAPGQVDFPPALLRDTYLAADAFVMPSRIEGFSTALLEAMAAGLPVLTTDAPGCREFIREGADGLMVARGDDENMAKQMERLLVDQDLRNKLAEKSRARAVEFGWPQIVSRYEALYAKLIREHQTAR